MEELISVEYSLPAGPRGKGSLDVPNSSSTQQLDGCVGEVLQDQFDRALKNPRDKSISVRFPLITPNSRIGNKLSIRKETPLDAYKLIEEGLVVHVKDLYPTNKIPVSLYERKTLPSGIQEINNSLTGLFETTHYLQTRSLTHLRKALACLYREYHLGWLWKKEWFFNEEKGKALLVEIRFYGIDTVIHAYDPKSLRGVAIEVILLNPGNPQVQCDLYICSNSNNYIGLVEGISLNRQEIPKPWNRQVDANYKNVNGSKICVE